MLAITDLQVRPEASFRSAPLKAENSYLICLFLSDYPKLQVWEDGRASPIGHVSAGQILILDLRYGPTLLVDKAFRLLAIYIPQDALDDVADISEAARIGPLQRTSGTGVADETIVNLLQTVAGGFQNPEAFGRLFLEHVSMAIVTHVAQTYGGMRPQSRAMRGGLATWQEKKVRELIQTRISLDLRVGDLADECNLSHRHFCRAFRHTVGTSPHAYIQTTRIEHAKKLLATTDMKLTDIGSACGFADQSHFTRVFTQFAGITPGLWRRNSAPVPLGEAIVPARQCWGLKVPKAPASCKSFAGFEGKVGSELDA